MTTTTIELGNVYITTGSVSGTTITHDDSTKCVKIWATKIDENLDNQLVVIPVPKSGASVNDITLPPTTKVVDIKRITQSLSVAGELINETSESAFTKKTNLKNMALFGGATNTGSALTVVWGVPPYQTLWKPNSSASEFGVLINKMMISETGGYSGESVSTDPTGAATSTGPTYPSETAYSIQIQLVRGQDALFPNT